MVSRSRISPTRMTSGSSRSAERSASAKPCVCRWISRWLTRQFLLWWTNSIGSSMVRMCPRSDVFLWSIIAARVVDLPDPVGPVTQHHAPWRVGDVLEDLRGVQLLQRENPWGDGSEHGAGSPVLVECVGAKPGEPGDLEREIRLEALFIVLALRIVHDAGDELERRRMKEHRRLDALQVAVDPDHRGKSGREMQVGRSVLHCECEQVANIHCSVLAPGHCRDDRDGPAPGRSSPPRWGGSLRSTPGFGNSPQARLM